MVECYKYSKWLWLKVLAVVFGMSYCVELAVKAWSAHVDIDMLGPEEYSTNIEIAVYSLLSAWFLNYIIVCLQRQNDFVGTDGGFLEINIHRNLLFPFSRKYARIDMRQVQDCEVTRLCFLIFIPYNGIKLKLKVGDKWHTFMLVGLNVSDKELVMMILGCGVPSVKHNTDREAPLFSIGILCVFPIVVAMAVVYFDETLMPSFVWIPICVWVMLMSVYWRDRHNMRLTSSFLMGILLGALTNLAILFVNYHFADWDEPAIRMEHTIRNSWSNYYPASGMGYRRKPAQRDYHVSFTTIGRNEERIGLRISKKQFKKAKKAATIILPMHRGILGYPVFDKDELEFRKRIKPRYNGFINVESIRQKQRCPVRFLQYK